MKRVVYLCFLMFAVTAPLAAQYGDREPSDQAAERGEGTVLLVGLHAGRALALEAGLGYMRFEDWGWFPRVHGASASLVAGFGEENALVGAELSAWIQQVVALGASVGYYTDFDGGTFVLYPEIGIGFQFGRLSARLAVAQGESVEELNDFEMSIRLPIPLFDAVPDR